MLDDADEALNRTIATGQHQSPWLLAAHNIPDEMHYCDGQRRTYPLHPKISDVLVFRETTAGNYILKYINIYAK